MNSTLLYYLSTWITHNSSETNSQSVTPETLSFMQPEDSLSIWQQSTTSTNPKAEESRTWPPPIYFFEVNFNTIPL
jgi:hypothetical protein